jgi:N6-adenosine-specific RNA methylase IME4
VKYRTIVADPPWQVGRGPEWSSNGASRPLTYETMSVEEIKSLPVRELAEVDAHLYLWTINAYIEAAYEIARDWGFRPSTLLTWCKPRHGIGLGGTFTLTTEHVLFCRRGRLPSLQRVDTSWWLWHRREHSAKPEHFLDLVEQISPAPYVELFSRRHRLGWDVWGNESANTAEMPA